MRSSFKYVLDEKEFPYNKNKLIKSIRFDISRYGQYTRTIRFRQKTSVECAIKAAEKYLSKPMSDYWWNMIKDDVFNDKDRERYQIRGDGVGDSKFLESIDIYGDLAVIQTGS